MHLSTQDINLEYLSAYFHMPINSVAKEIGVCATVLKKICRRNGIPRWPHRKIKSLDKMISNLENTVPKNSEEEIKISKEIASIKKKKNFLIKNPNILGMKNQNHLINLSGSIDSGNELDGHSIHPTSLLIDSLINSSSSNNSDDDSDNQNYYSTPQLSPSSPPPSTISSPITTPTQIPTQTFSPIVNFLKNQNQNHHQHIQLSSSPSTVRAPLSPKTPLQSPLFICNQAPPPTAPVTQAPIQKPSTLHHLLNDTEYEITLPKLNIPQSFVEAPLKTLEPSFPNKSNSSNQSPSSPPQSPTQSHIFSQSQTNNFVYNNQIHKQNHNYFFDNNNNNNNYNNFKSNHENEEYSYIHNHQQYYQYQNSLSKSMFHKNDFESSLSRADLNNAMAVMVMATLMNSANSVNSNNNNNNSNATRDNTARLNRMDFNRVVPAVIQNNNNISFDDQL